MPIRYGMAHEGLDMSILRNISTMAHDATRKNEEEGEGRVPYPPFAQQFAKVILKLLFGDVGKVQPNPQAGNDVRQVIRTASALAFTTCVFMGCRPPVSEADRSTPIPAAYRPTQAQEMARPKVVEALRAACVRFDRSSPDFSPMDDGIRKARVVGLGQQTHGSREVFRAQADLFMYMVAKHGVRTLLFEEDFAAAQAVNEFAHGADTDMASMTSGLQTPWRVEEVGRLAGAIRDWNAAHPGDGIDIIGVDDQMTSPKRALDAALGVMFPEEAVKWRGLAPKLERFTTSVWSREWVGYDLDELVRLRSDAGFLLRAVEKSAISAAPMDRLSSILAARAIAGMLDARISSAKADRKRVGKDISDVSSYQIASRDTRMAANVMLFLNIFPDRKCAVWAHTLHTGKDSSNVWEPMGSKVAMLIGNEKWCSVGFGTRGGTVTAVDARDWSKLGSGVKNASYYKAYPYPQPVRGTFEEMLHDASGDGDAMCDLGKTKPDGWLNMSYNTYMLGAVMNLEDAYDDRYFECRPSSFFDYYILLDATTATEIVDSFGRGTK